MLSLLTWVAVLAFAGPVSPVSAKLLYVLGDLRQYPGPVDIYDIQKPSEMVFKAEHTVTQEALGSVGLAMDSRNEFLFVTYEDSAIVRAVDVRTWTYVTLYSINGATNLAGVVYDNHKKVLYCIDRFTPTLVLLEWDSIKALRQKDNSPVSLGDLRGVGLALDETNDLLFVTDATNEVSVFRTSDWSLVKTIKLSHPAISVAVDYTRQLLYTGAGYRGDLNLVRYDLASGNETSVQVSDVAGVIGVTVDDLTGVVYLTTGRDNEMGGDELRAYSSSLELLQNLYVGGNPTGLALPLSGFAANPPGLSKKVVSGVKEIQGIQYAQPGGLLTYEVSVDNKANWDGLTEVTVQDSLPAEVNFVRVEGLDSAVGQYDGTSHVFTCSLSSLEPNTSVSFRLVGQVKDSASAGTVITNQVLATSQESDPATATAQVTVAYASLVLKKTVMADPNHIVVGDIVYVAPGSTLTYDILVANPDNTYPIPQVIAVDTLPQEVEYVAGQGDLGTGLYDPTVGAYTQTYTALQPNTVTHFWITVRVRDDVAAGTRVKNSVLINGLWTPPAQAEAVVVVRHKALNVTKTITKPSGDSSGVVYVNVGETATFQIVVDNADNDLLAHNVLVIDTLPNGVDYVSSGSGGVYYADAHSVSWAVPSLMAGGEERMELVVRVNSAAVPGGVLVNTVTAQSDETIPVQDSASFTPLQNSLQALNLELIYSDPVCAGCSGLLQAVLTLPPEVKRQDVDTALKLVLNPGGAAATSQIVYGYDGTVKIRAFFDMTELLKSVSGYGRVSVTVKGWLQSGRTFTGQKDLLITSTMRRKG
jgi:uncharacterized repeat protein (TIGR01451 family)